MLLRFLGVDVVTIGVYENNEIAHNCYKRVGFVDREIVEKEPWNVIEMEIKKDKGIIWSRGKWRNH